MMLLDNPKGNYKFVKGEGVPFSAGALADSGFEIVRVSLKPLVRLSTGFELIERHLNTVGRPLNAICGIELRIPGALSAAGFEEFNREYLERITAWGVMIDRLNPIARTNVAPAVAPIAEASLHGFCYTVPAPGSDRPGFVLAGATEMTSRDRRREIVAAGDVSLDGLRRKTVCVLETLGKLLAEMKVAWNDATAVNLYTVRDLHSLLATDLLPAIGSAAHRGIRWYFARPPVHGLELEIDCYAACEEVVLAP